MGLPEDIELSAHEYAAVFIFGALGVITSYGFLNIDSRLAVHFNSAGVADGFMPLIPGLALIPLLTVLLYILLKHLPELDPLGDNYESFETSLEHFTLAIVGLMTYIQGLIVAWNTGTGFNMSLAITPGIAVIYFLVGSLMEDAERNWFVGLRNPWTLNSDYVWEQTHRKAGPIFRVAGALALLAIPFTEYSLIFLVGPVLSAAVFLTAYSYWLYSVKEEE